jgi:glycosyltransferase involved in cell wall biosynthesis
MRPVTEAAPPLFSIVTPCLNRAGSIGHAIESVLAQNYLAFEHIVIDGGSTDGTLDVLARYPHLRVVSEPDRNLYDAINKGLRLARGDVLGLLNSDDLYAPGAFDAAAGVLADPAMEMVIGGAEIFTLRDGRDTVTRRYTGPRATGLHEANPIGNVTLINASFWRRSLHARIGLFDDRFPLAADKDFWMRLALAPPAHRLVPRILYRYLSHAGSLTFSDTDQRDKLSAHLLAVARVRLAECRPGTSEHAAYRRWHAWALGYRASQHVLHGRAREAIRTAHEGLSTDSAWPFRFLARLPSHWRDRHIRRGEPEPRSRESVPAPYWDAQTG